jgi:hypothetical protein
MRSRITILAVAAQLVCLSLAVSVARAQGTCDMNTFTGTYVFYERGASAVLDPTQTPTLPFHWVGEVAPFATVGQVTMWPSGVGDGFYWIRTGSFNGGANPLPVAITVTEMNADCTGKFTYMLPGAVPGAPPTTIVERFILFDNGREFRTIPTEIINGLTPLAWIGEGHRLSESGIPPLCGPQTTRGSYLMSAENLVRPGSVVADTVLLLFDVSMDGELTGTLYEKLGPTGNIQLAMAGTIAVAPDCSFAATINVTIQGNPRTIPMRGVFFDQGKRLFGLNVGGTSTGGTQWSFGQGQRIK